MKLDEALGRIAPVVGLSSLIGAPGSIGTEPDGVPTLAEAQEKLAGVRNAQAKANSDYAWWGYEGEKAFWETVVSLLEAAAITGPDNLPDVDGPDTEGRVVMDACAAMTRWGRQVKHAAAHPEGGAE